MGTNRTPLRIISTGVDKTTPVDSVMSETYTPDPSGISGTRVKVDSVLPCGISVTSGSSGTSAVPPSGGL